MKAKKYKIKTVQDIVDCTNEENLDRFLADFKAMLQSANSLKKITKSLNDINDVQSANFESMTWIDDGEQKVTISIDVH